MKNPNLRVIENTNFNPNLWTVQGDLDFTAAMYGDLEEPFNWEVRSLDANGDPNGSGWIQTIGTYCHSSCYPPQHLQHHVSRTGLPGPHFEFRFRGEWTGKIVGTAKTTALFDTPASPTALAAVASSSSIALSWTDGSTNESSFEIQRAEGDEGSFSTVATVGSNVTSLTNSVTTNTLYRYRVRAVGAYGHGSGWSNEAVTFASESMANGQDLIPFEIALAAAFALDPSNFCAVLALSGLPSMNENSAPDVWEACEAQVIASGTLRNVLLAVAAAAAGSVALDMLQDEYVALQLVPTVEEEEDPPAPWTPPENWEDNGCNQEVNPHASNEAHVDIWHGWGVQRGSSEFYEHVDWRWLAFHDSLRVMAEPSAPESPKCQRVVTFHSPVGILRGSDIVTDQYTVITLRVSGELVTAYPGTPDD